MYSNILQKSKCEKHSANTIMYKFKQIFNHILIANNILIILLNKIKHTILLLILYEHVIDYCSLSILLCNKWLH